MSSKTRTTSRLRKEKEMLNGDLINGASEAAKFIGISPRTVYHMCEAGTLPFIKKGKRLYFRKSELEAAFRSQAAA